MKRIAQGDNLMRKLFVTLALLSVTVLISACSPEVGSEEWCADIKEKGVANVTASEAADFTKHCIL